MHGLHVLAYIPKTSKKSISLGSMHFALISQLVAIERRTTSTLDFKGGGGLKLAGQARFQLHNILNPVEKTVPLLSIWELSSYYTAK